MRSASPKLTPFERAALAEFKRRGLTLVEADEGPARDFSEYRDDPARFFEEVLGLTPWKRQRDILGAIAEHDQVAVRSGHKVSKSCTAAGVAVWWICTRPNGQVVMTAPTFRQVKNILWRELKFRWPKVRAALKGPPAPKDPATGIELDDGRQLYGLSTNEQEALAGISGPELLFIVDEASGFPDDLWEVIEGNMAGGAKVLAISNPTRTTGWFFNIFKRRNPDWVRLHISSEETPNVETGERVIPGIATREWVEKMRRACGDDYENHPVYMVRVRGEFPAQASTAVIGFRLVQEASERWEESVPAGPLRFGLDVARYGDDEIILAPRRGNHAYKLKAIPAGDGVEVAEAVLAAVRPMRRQMDEPVHINVDGIGVGSAVVDGLRYAERMGSERIYIHDVCVGEASTDGDHHNLRSQLWFGVEEWLKEGGAIPPDEKLEAELLCPTYSFDSRNRKRVMSKDDIRKELKRSPDRADALALSVHEPNTHATGLRRPNPSKFAGRRGKRRGLIV